MQTFTGVEYIKIDIANHFGLDKLSWADRIQWVDDHYSDLAVLDQQADEPVLFRKAVRAYRQALLKQPTGHLVGLDATASGIQMLACISGCVQSASKVNLVNTGKREDIYQSMVNEMATHGASTDRKTIKKPIMTFFYGSTAMPAKVFGEASSELAAFNQSLIEGLPGAYELMQLFQSHWDPGAEYYEWMMPDRHVVRIPVTAVITKKIEVDEWNHTTFKYQTSVVQAQDRGRALAANITHAIDSWVLREMIRAAHRQGFKIATIHDAYFAHPNYMNQVRRNYLAILQQLTGGNMVKFILEQITNKPCNYVPKQEGLAQLIEQAEYPLS